MLTIGPYAFSVRDAERAVEEFDDFWSAFTDRRDAGLVDHLRPTLTGNATADLPAVWAAYLAVGPALRAAGALPATATGTVAALHASGGGVPKAARDSLEVGFAGARGDAQRNRNHHGAPYQALCLWSGEIIDSLTADGHPIAPGRAGENVTLRGLDWSDVRPGVRLRLGSVLCEISCYAEPCRHLSQWFSDGRFDRIRHDKGDVSRVYATVLEPGVIEVGTDAVLEPN
ncbi:MAG: hypothetical protein RJB65_1466 [Actinomycetota bacterium]|jgi:MOSC domain-containing protein YiiM